MRYVFLILVSLVIGIPSVAHADSDYATSVPSEVEFFCQDDCASYSSDGQCEVADGTCAETYDQCYGRCVLPGGSTAPASGFVGVHCTPVGVIMWKEDMVIREQGGWWRYRYRYIKLERCGALHYLSFGEWRNHLVLPQ